MAFQSLDHANYRDIDGICGLHANIDCSDWLKDSLMSLE